MDHNQILIMKLNKFNREQRKNSEKRAEIVHMPHLFSGGESKKNKAKRTFLFMKKAKN